MLPQLPLDILVYILKSIPVARLDDDGTRVLVSCLQVNHLFYDVFSDPSIWRAHYHCRYTLFEHKSESDRRRLFKNDWRALYAERRWIDKVAIAHLQNMIVDRPRRYEQATALARMSLDIWDVLDIVRQLPIPLSFRVDPWELDGRLDDHALTRRYWASLMADIIIKCSALDVWKAVVEEDDSPSTQPSTQTGSSFELTMSVFSCFFGKPLAETTLRLDRLADECGKFLADEGSEPSYDLTKICRNICLFMYLQGFGIAEPRQYRAMLNHFPHSYLMTNKRTLPISLAHIFIAISRRFGIDASPINFPGVVLVHVATQGSEVPDIIVNPSTMDPAKCIMRIPDDIQAVTPNFPVSAESLSRLLVPSNAKAMLVRASHNILFAFQEDITLDFDHWQPAMFAAISAQFLLQADLPFLRILTNSLLGLTTLDCSIFILDKLSSMVPRPHRDLLEQRCDPVITEEAIVASIRRTRQGNTAVKYFVGMVLEHALYNYIGCIIGWDFTCKTSEGWIRRMQVDELTRGRNQPFYRVIVDDGTSRYVAEENIRCVNPSLEIVHKLYSRIPELPTFFEDAELHREGWGWARGRFLLSLDSLLAYPQDDEVAATQLEMTTFVNRSSTSYYRPAVYGATQAQAQRAPDVRDDYERWYTETVPNNRMALSVRSGIHSEIAWSLDRLCRLCHNEQFVLKTIPGLIDSLFEWPEWYVSEGHKVVDEHILFSLPLEYARQRQFALESLFVLRNSSFNDQNAWEIYNHTHTVPLVLNALQNLDFEQDENIEFILYCMDLLHIISAKMILNSLNPNPLPPLLRIASQTKDRSLIIASLIALTLIFSSPLNVSALTPTSTALLTSIRYLPLVVDKALLDACLNYLYTHVSHVSMARAFLLHPEMPRVLKLLANVLIAEQPLLQEKVTLDVTGPIQTVPATHLSTRNHELTKEELDSLIELPEPQRCYDWMRLVFIAKQDGVVTQVDFWNLYKDTFTPYIDKYPLLVASDVIKNVNAVFPSAQAMVLQDPVQRFVVQGVDRRKDAVVTERFRCLWDHFQCTAAPFASASELYDHILQHLIDADATELPCLWGSCPRAALRKPALRSHLLTHLSSMEQPQKHPSQSDTITLSEGSQYPMETPTTRPPPPPRNTVITYDKLVKDPSSTSLTALLVLRILFRTSFASADAAPRVDADHFGFPGMVEETDEQESDYVRDEPSEREGERRGRKAFVGVRHLLENVKIKDEVLMEWVTEMIDAV
ncbi:hypothetical protein APHAL10511_006015 [Amanita phalloides]|nr:hypothetical protein APHAL10511_006015 [Amanita phalloides]